MALSNFSVVDIAGRGLDHLYLAARRVEGGIPCLKAAESLVKAVRPKDNVIIGTGFTIAKAQRGETDGPPGAAVLAKQLEAMDVHTTIMTDPHNVEMVESVCREVKAGNCGVEPFPPERGRALEETQTILKDFCPSALIAIERPGWNRKQVYHTLSGVDISRHCSPLDILFEEAFKRGVLTVGIGDGGNEIGMGRIRESVEEFIPNGRTCKCPCGGGIAAVTETSHVLVGGTSNLASYALTASYALLTNSSYTHDGAEEAKLIHAAFEAGAVDGITGAHTPSVDTIPVEINSRLADVINSLATGHKQIGL